MVMIRNARKLCQDDYKKCTVGSLQDEGRRCKELGNKWEVLT